MVQNYGRGALENGNWIDQCVIFNWNTASINVIIIPQNTSIPGHKVAFETVLRGCLLDSNSQIYVELDWRSLGVARR